MKHCENNEFQQNITSYTADNERKQEKKKLINKRLYIHLPNI